MKGTTAKIGGKAGGREREKRRRRWWRQQQKRRKRNRGEGKGRKEKTGVQQASFLPLDPVLPEARATHGLVSYMRGKPFLHLSWFELGLSHATKSLD